MAIKIAVAMCVYHGDQPAYLKQALESIQAQTVRASVFLYVDGPVSRELERVIFTESSVNDVQIFQSETNLGLACGLNTLLAAIELLDFDYVARMDADDLMRPDRLEKQVSFLEKNRHVDVLGGACKEFGSDYARGVRKKPSCAAELYRLSFFSSPFIHPTVMFRSSSIAGVRYPEAVLYSEDIGLWLSMAVSGKTFGNLEEVILDFRLTAETVQRRTSWQKFFSELKLRCSGLVQLESVREKFFLGFLIVVRLSYLCLPVFIKKLFLRKNI